MRKLKKQFFTVFLVCALMLALSIVPVAAATTTDSQPALNYDVYFQLDGITGESVTIGYEKWIELADVQFGVANTASNETGSGLDAGKAEVNYFTITKKLDSSSISLFLSTVTGKHLKSGKIVFADRGERHKPVLTIDLNDVILSNYNFNNGFEVLNLNFRKIQLSYSKMDSKGAQTTPITGGFDFIQNEVR